MKCLIFWTAVKDLKVEIISILIETGGLLNLEPEYIVEKRKYKKLEIMQPMIKNKAELVNKPTRISPHEVLRSWLISTLYQLLVKNN